MAAMKAPLIRIEPENEIRFVGPFNSTVSTQLRLINLTDKKVFFKIKTTAPRSYCVRPNNGLIDAAETGVVQVMLQPFEYNPNDRERNKHKFMVQSRYAPEDATIADSDNAFKSVVEGVEMHDARLRCLFELPAPSDDLNPSSTSDPLQQPEEKSVNLEPPETTVPSQDASFRLEIETIRKRNTALLMENMELKKGTTGARPIAAATNLPPQRKTFTLLNILLALMILVLGWIIGRSF